MWVFHLIYIHVCNLKTNNKLKKFQISRYIHTIEKLQTNSSAKTLQCILTKEGHKIFCYKEIILK